MEILDRRKISMTNKLIFIYSMKENEGEHPETFHKLRINFVIVD